MSRRNLPRLTNGAILNLTKNELGEKPILQVLEPAESGGNDHNRIMLSDGKNLHSFEITQELKLFDIFTIVQILKYSVVIEWPSMGNDQPSKKLISLLDVQRLVHGKKVGSKIGNPQLLKYPEEEEPTASSNRTGLEEKSDIVTRLPIVALTPYNPFKKWKVKVRITSKSNIHTWSNSKGEGKHFSMGMKDETGEIKATAFNAECDKFYHLIEVDKVYYISNSISLMAANKLYTRIKNNYEITFNKKTTVIPCHDDASSIPCISFDFVPIDQLTNKLTANLKKEKIFIDVIGVAKSASEVYSVYSASKVKEYEKIDVHLVDTTSNKGVTLQIWGKASEDFDASSQPIVALKGVELLDYNGCSLRSNSETVMQINPDRPEAHKLRTWFDNRSY